MYYLFKQSMAHRESSEFPLVAMFDFKEIKFNRCECKPETTQGHCYEVEYNFQNYIAFLPNEAFLLSLFIVPFLMHVLHAALLHLTPPVTMLNFVLGSRYEGEEKESMAIDEIEMEPMNTTDQVEQIYQIQTKQPDENRSQNCRMFTMIHLISLIFGILMILEIMLLPSYGFGILFDKSEGKNGKLELF